MVRSRQVLQNTQTEATSLRTPPSRRRRLSCENAYETPHNSRHLTQSITTILCQEPISRNVRRLLHKTGKAMDQLQWLATQATIQLTAKSKQLDELKAVKKKKAPIDCNEVFASIESMSNVGSANSTNSNFSVLL